MAEDFWKAQSAERVFAALMAAFRELAKVEDVLAEGLGYARSEGGADDPNGGGFITGEHTALSLAGEAAAELGRLRREVEFEAHGTTPGRPDPLRALAERLVRLDDPTNPVGCADRQTITLNAIIGGAREALEGGVSSAYASTEGAPVSPVQTGVHADTTVPGGDS